VPIHIPRRITSTLAGRFGPIGVERHEVEAGGDPYDCYTIQLADWVAVAAVTEDGQLVLVRQHRHGLDAVTVEVAGGIIDPGEAPDVAALRELREETGYAAEALEPLGWVHPNPALQANRCFLYLAIGARRVGPPQGDEHESVEPVLMTPDDAAAAVRDGRITHALAVVTLERTLAALARGREAPAAQVGEGEGRKDEVTEARTLLRRVAVLLDSMEETQRGKVVDLARRLLPHVTAEDIRNPHDFPELDDPDWHFEDGQLAGIQAVRFALHGLSRDVLGDEEADQGSGSARPAGGD